MYNYDKENYDFKTAEQQIAEQKEAIEAKKLILKATTAENRLIEVLDHVDSLFEELL